MLRKYEAVQPEALPSLRSIPLHTATPGALAAPAWEAAPASRACRADASARAPRAQTQFMPSGQVARRLNISPRTLGKLTGNIYAVVAAPPARPPVPLMPAKTGFLP
jgi:hypothetical protein